MSELVTLRAPSRAPSLPHTVELPTRYYGRLALAETAAAFEGVATVKWTVGEGAIRLTFREVDASAGEVIDEFLNHLLYASAAAGPEYTR